MESMKQAKIEWKQGQPVSQRFDDIYFSREDGVAESEYVFLKNNDLPDRWLNSQQFVIAETGFGTGLNFLITLRHWLATAPENARLHYYSIEKYPLTVSDLEKALSVWPEYQTLLDELLAVYPPAVKGCHPLYLCDRRVTLVLMFGDITEMLRELPTSVDVWYLDGFAPAKNPEMWTADIFKGIAQHSHRGSHFSTFTAVGDVRRGLTDAGFEVRRVRGFASKREMLVGSLQTERPVRQAMPWFKLPVSNISSKKVAVIGAGIAGITTAWALANRGWQVSLLEQCSDIAQQASGNPLGVLMPRITLDQSVEGEFYASAFFSC